MHAALIDLAVNDGQIFLHILRVRTVVTDTTALHFCYTANITYSTCTRNPNLSPDSGTILTFREESQERSGRGGGFVLCM